MIYHFTALLYELTGFITLPVVLPNLCIENDYCRVWNKEAGLITLIVKKKRESMHYLCFHLNALYF